MHPTVAQLKQLFQELGDPERAQAARRFMKSGPGEYAEGDRFLGISVPVLRAQVKLHQDAPIEVPLALLHSPLHEERLFALLLLVRLYQRGDQDQRQAVYDLYVGNLPWVNNWDLVDSSAMYIVGPQLMNRDRSILYIWVKSDSLWERRVAILSTFHFIRLQDFDDTLRLAEHLLDDPEDLIHKAVGWMLRELGKRDPEGERAFLRTHYQRMPRTMLRYAIEKFPVDERKKYLNGFL